MADDKTRIAIKIDHFAIRTFRDTADCDYISARLSSRARLHSQFLWQSQQTVEKLLKCILLLNRVPAKKLRHDIVAALDLIKTLPFEITLSDSSIDFLRYIDRFGEWRYLETSYFTKGLELQKLDQLVWQLRRYCQRLQKRDPQHHSRFTALESDRIDEILESTNRAPQDFKLADDGFLEKIVADRSNRARAPLIWKNLYFGVRRRRQITVDKSFHATNAPLWMYPELVDYLVPYILIPDRIADAYRQQARERDQGKGGSA